MMWVGYLLGPAFVVLGIGSVACSAWKRLR